MIQIDPKVMDEKAEEVIRTTPTIPRKSGITKKDLIEHGFAEDCPGCKATLRLGETVAYSRMQKEAGE